jgi:hypothetical protein
MFLLVRATKLTIIGRIKATASRKGFLMDSLRKQVMRQCHAERVPAMLCLL